MLWTKKKPDEWLEEHLRALTRRVDDLESANKRLSLEWEELYDKVRRQMARMSKRYAVDRKENGADVESAGQTDAFQGHDPISRSIMMRRARTGGMK